MSRFNFRHYNKLAKAFTYYGAGALQVDLNREFKSGLVFPMADGSSMYMGTYSELQQSTGLKDSNGRLIFEGDILKETYVSEGKTYTDITVVKYDEKSAGFIMARPALEKDITYFDDINLEKENFVVIGNIYENPELLEVSDGDNSSE